jgi:hypothetical protein
MVRTEINLRSFFTGEQDGGEWLVSSTGHVIPGAKGSNKNYTGNWMGPRKILNVVKRKDDPIPGG